MSRGESMRNLEAFAHLLDRREADARDAAQESADRRGPGRCRRAPACARLAGMTYTLVLLRHGESDWNQKNLFTGWVDVDLTEQGRAEAVARRHAAGGAGLLPDVVHTSVLRRAITTANLALDAADRHWIPVRRSWRLNERHYGALQGLDKAATRDKYGDEQFMLWRR